MKQGKKKSRCKRGLLSSHLLQMIDVWFHETIRRALWNVSQNCLLPGEWKGGTLIHRLPSPALLGCAYMCTEQFPTPIFCLNGAHSPGGTHGPEGAHSMLVKAWVWLADTVVAPVRGKAKRIWKDVQVAGKEGGILWISSEEVYFLMMNEIFQVFQAPRGN